MADKAIIIAILTKLQGHRDLADGLLALVQSADMKSEVYDALIKILHHAYKNAHDKDEKRRLQRSIELMQGIHQKEENEQKLTDADVVRLLDEIDHA